MVDGTHTLTMIGQADRMKIINSRLTGLIINLHERGYTEDFFFDGASPCLWMQQAEVVCYAEFTINIVNQCYDSLTNSYQYIHLVETPCGMKGLLISNNLYFNSRL
jgi:hypothetical protein